MSDAVGDSIEPPTGARPAAGAEAVHRHAARRQGLTVGIATGLYAISFGALSVASGLSIAQTQVLSAVLFSGGSQFAMVGILGGGGTAVSAVATSTLLATRNMFYGLRMAQLLEVTGWRRALAAQLTIDESTAVGTAQPTATAQRLGFWVTGLTVFICWNVMTFLGALAGNAIGDPKSWGLDAAASAAFAALLWPRLRGRPALATAIGAAAIAIGLSPFTAVGVPVICAVGAAIGVSLRRSS